MICKIDYISVQCIEKIEKFLLENEVYDCSLATGLSGVFALISDCESKDNIINLGQYILNNCIKNDISLFSGLSGIGTSFLIANQNYDLSDIIIKLVNIIINNGFEFNHNLLELRCIDYDLAYGYTGVVAFMLSVLDSIDNIDDKSLKKINNLIYQYLDYVDYILGNPIKGHHPFWISKENQMIDLDKILFDAGSYNMGIAHGVLGVIQVVIRIYNMRLFSKKAKQIILKLVDLVLNFLVEREGNLIIPPRSTDNRKILDSDKFLFQDGWCYGQLSIGLTLLNAGNVVNKKKYQDIGKRISNQSLSRILDIDSFLPSPIVCHGKSSTLLLLCYAARNNLLDELRIKNDIITIGNILINQYDERHIFGFQDREYEGSNTNYVYFDKFNLLEGTTGIVLTLQLIKQYLSGNYCNNIFLNTFIN